MRNEHFAVLAEYAANQSGEVVLIGDLNATVWSPWYRRLTRQAGLREAQLERGYRATWSPYDLPLFLGLPIDHVLLSDGFTSVERSYPPRMSSDHRPIVTGIGTGHGRGCTTEASNSSSEPNEIPIVDNLGSGSPADRTRDTLIKSQVLYH